MARSCTSLEEVQGFQSLLQNNFPSILVLTVDWDHNDSDGYSSDPNLSD